MHAGRDQHHGGFRNIGHSRYVQAYGHDEIVPVTVTVDPDGPYWGWIGSGREETGPTMIQQHEGIFSMQFPYGPAAEEKAGKGRVVRLSIAETEAVAEPGGRPWCGSHRTHVAHDGCAGYPTRTLLDPDLAP